MRTAQELEVEYGDQLGRCEIGGEIVDTDLLTLVEYTEDFGDALVCFTCVENYDLIAVDVISE